MSRAGQVLATLEDLRWRIVRLHATRRGGVIITALNEGRIAAVELPARLPNEADRAWIERLERLFVESAYDPLEASPPVLVLALPDDLAELLPDSPIQAMLAR